MRLFIIYHLNNFIPWDNEIINGKKLLLFYTSRV
jgi:hypothetical protein